MPMRSGRTGHFNYPLPGLGYGLAAALCCSSPPSRPSRPRRPPPGRRRASRPPSRSPRSRGRSTCPGPPPRATAAPRSPGTRSNIPPTIPPTATAPAGPPSSKITPKITRRPPTPTPAMTPERPTPTGSRPSTPTAPAALQRRQRRRNTSLQRAVQRTGALQGVDVLHNRRPESRTAGDGALRPPLGVRSHLRHDGHNEDPLYCVQMNPRLYCGGIRTWITSG